MLPCNVPAGSDEEARAAHWPVTHRAVREGLSLASSRVTGFCLVKGETMDI